MDTKRKIDVIIVGGGPAGLSCAMTIAKAGKKVLVVERGDFAGSKNVFGGAIYLKPTVEIFPKLLETAPLERINTKHNYALLTEKEAVTIGYKSEDKGNSATVLRSKFDKWLSKQITEAGAYIAPKTLVKSLSVENGKVVGIETELEKYYAPLVIIAQGVNTLLAEQIGLRKKTEAKNVAVGVKEVIKLPKETIEARFNLSENEGAVNEIIGYPMSDILGLGYIYTNKESVVVGLGVGLDCLAEKKLKPYELLDKLKEHPSIAPLIKGGETIEYSAHLIPEGGFKDIPKLYSDGVMVIGDSASLVNNVHWEGTNLAMVSGKLAGEIAVEAINSNDFSQNMLKKYQQKLEESFVFEDLKSYKNVMDIAHKRVSSFFGFYPKKMCEFFETFTSVDSMPKRKKFRKFVGSLFTQRCICEYFKDFWAFIRLITGVMK